MLFAVDEEGGNSAAPELLAAWTFRRSKEWLTIRREVADGALRLIVVENARPRSFSFDSLDRLVAFQVNMESSLVSAGWSLAEFTPDRRHRGERRSAPRATTDRRRWWTDVKP